MTKLHWLGGLGGLVLLSGSLWWGFHAHKPVHSTVFTSTPSSLSSGVASIVSQKTHRSTPIDALQTINHQNALHMLATLPPALQKSHGVITPALVGISKPSQGPRPNLITGITTEWQHVIPAVRSQHLPPHLTDGIRISQTVWEAGWRQAAQDAIVATGNDPLAILQNAGPGSASHFVPLIKTLYSWDTHHGSAHWMSQIIANVGLTGLRGIIHIYPATHQIPGQPRVITLMTVPMLLTEYGYSPVHRQKPQSTIQTAIATMALTDYHHHWQWWIEALQLGPQQPITFPSEFLP